MLLFLKIWIGLMLIKFFERLREVNTLANIQLQKKIKKFFVFFYLLRDDIFISKDRTKFF